MSAPPRPLLLTGFMGTGKTTLGRAVAAAAAAEFKDLDHELERRQGRSVKQLFAELGEVGFRRLERALLRELLASVPYGKAFVLALGGGTLLDRELRLWALEQGVVVSLHAPPELLLSRLAGDTTRPLLADAEPLERIRALLEARGSSYWEAHLSLDTAEFALNDAVDLIRAVWARGPIAVAAGSDSYAVEVGSGVLEQRVTELLSSELRPHPTGHLWVTDANVDRHYAASRHRVSAAVGGPTDAHVVLEPGEAHKSLDALPAVYHRCLTAELDRSGVLIALGGGVVTDMTGFVAATWMRGVRWVGLPSSLLAMVDASVGGKTAVDFGPAKNAVGAFWQPSAVVCDVALLATEPERGFNSALSEVIKTALIGDPELLELMERDGRGVLARDPQLLIEVVRRSVAVKARIVSRDPREQAERAHLNLGHTMGHALEAYAGYGNLTHGEAISLGLVAALRFGVSRGHTPPDLAVRVERLLSDLGLPTDLTEHQLPAAAALLGHDKKRSGTSVRFIFARGVGEVFSERVQLPELAVAAQSL